MKLFKTLLVVFAIIIVQSNLFGQTSLYGDTSTLTPADSTFLEIAAKDSLSENTVTKDTTKFSPPYYRTLSIGFAFASDLPDPEYDDETTTGSYLKLSAIFHEKTSSIYPSFVQIDYIVGFGESNDVFMINYMFGKSFAGSYSDVGGMLAVDVGIGMSHFWGKHSGQPESDDDGISGVTRIGYGYNGFAVSFETNIILTRDYSIEIFGMNFSYTF